MWVQDESVTKCIVQEYLVQAERKLPDSCEDFPECFLSRLKIF